MFPQVLKCKEPPPKPVEGGSAGAFENRGLHHEYQRKLKEWERKVSMYQYLNNGLFFAIIAVSMWASFDFILVYLKHTDDIPILYRKSSLIAAKILWGSASTVVSALAVINVGSYLNMYD